MPVDGLAIGASVQLRLDEVNPALRLTRFSIV
jgi:hypothetical protein